MPDEPKNEPAKKLRRLLNGGKNPAMTRLPKKGGVPVSTLPSKDDEKTQATAAVKTPKTPMVVTTPKKKFALPSMPKAAGSFKNVSFASIAPAFWTIASALSLTVNLILIIILFSLLFGVKKSGISTSNMINLGSSFLGGLYTNFEKMDNASINTDVKVETTIPVKFDLQLNQQTSVVLSQDVTINNALVTVNTGGLNITRANTTIVLPQGTTLPIVLNLSVPVDTTVPVTLNVPVNIPLNQTQLHVPFTGLQDVVGPFYCMLAPAAVNLEQQPICPYQPAQ
jgi:hypothetical protein